jgi:long-chain acyl-CoA synthetase
MRTSDSEFDDSPLPALLKDAARRCPHHIAVASGDRDLPFSTFDEVSDRIAGFLAAQGIEKGDRVGLCCPNSDVFALAYFGILKAGATVVPLNLSMNPKELSFVLQDARVRGLIYHELFTEAVSGILQQLGGSVVCLRAGSAGQQGPGHAWRQAVEFSGPRPRPVFDTGEDVAVVLYTSGTTGRPKGAMLTHRNLAANSWSVRKAFQIQPGEDVVLVVLPMFHAFAATVGMLTPLFSGCTLAPVPRFDPQLVADAIQARRATIFLGVPSMYNLLLRLPQTAVDKLASLRWCISGGAALPEAVMEQFETRFGKPIYEGDGPTECSPVTCVNPIGGVRKPGSVGLPVPLVQMKVLDGGGRELPDGETGEICVKGPNVMKGYWGLPEETRAAFFGDWFRTGDAGYRDGDGYFHLVDRLRDMLIVNGMNVYPRVVEEVLYRAPAVLEAAVVGEPHELHGEIPVAYVVLREGHVMTQREIRAFCRENLGRHEVPRRIYLLPALPKNAAGKILKRALSGRGEVERGVDLRRPG